MRCRWSAQTTKWRPRRTGRAVQLPPSPAQLPPPPREKVGWRSRVLPRARPGLRIFGARAASALGGSCGSRPGPPGRHLPEGSPRTASPPICRSTRRPACAALRSSPPSASPTTVRVRRESQGPDGGRGSLPRCRARSLGLGRGPTNHHRPRGHSKQQQPRYRDPADLAGRAVHRAVHPTWSRRHLRRSAHAVPPSGAFVRSAGGYRTSSGTQRLWGTKTGCSALTCGCTWCGSRGPGRMVGL